MAGERILIVEDEARIADVLERYLRADGFRVERAGDGKRALELWRAADPDLILLDLMIPEPDGLEVARRIRAESDVPIVMVTAKVEEEDRLRGLELGADDYVSKPFSPREVVARLHAVLRRAQGRVRAPRHHAVGDLEVDHEAAEVRCRGEAIEVSRAQFHILATLLEAPGRAFTRMELLDALEGSWADERVIDAHVKNLRHRLGGCRDQLVTVRGVGYKVQA